MERALAEGRVTILGERGKASASREFLLRLGDLAPSLRRLALAKACTLPWAERPDEMPACFQWELTRAMGEALEDRGAHPEMDGVVDELFASEPAPISEVLLRQVVPMTPTTRYFSLIFALAWDDAPEWLTRELAYAKWVVHDEYRAWRAVGWVD